MCGVVVRQEIDQTLKYLWEKFASNVNQLLKEGHIGSLKTHNLKIIIS